MNSCLADLNPCSPVESVLKIVSLESFEFDFGENITQDYMHIRGFPGGASGKKLACQYRRYKRGNSIPGSGRSPGRGHGNPLQCSCLGKSHGQGSLTGYRP